MSQSIPLPPDSRFLSQEFQAHAKLGWLIAELDSNDQTKQWIDKEYDEQIKQWMEKGFDREGAKIAVDGWRHRAFAYGVHQLDPATVPGLDRIILVCDRLYDGTGLTLANVRKLRAALCEFRKCSMESANALSLDEVATELGEIASMSDPSSLELIENAMRTRGGQLNPQQMGTPGGKSTPGNDFQPTARVRTKTKKKPGPKKPRYDISNDAKVYNQWARGRTAGDFVSYEECDKEYGRELGETKAAVARHRGRQRNAK